MGPLSLVSHGHSLCSPHLWDGLLGASTAHLCCTRLRAATSLKGDVSFPALSVLPPIQNHLCSYLVLTEFLLCVETGRIPSPSVAAGLLGSPVCWESSDPLLAFSLVAWFMVGQPLSQWCPPTVGQHQDGSSGSWQGFSRSCPSICSLRPPLCQHSPHPDWGSISPAGGGMYLVVAEGRCSTGAPIAADTLHLPPVFAAARGRGCRWRLQAEPTLQPEQGRLWGALGPVGTRW